MQKMSKKLALVSEAQRALQNGFIYRPWINFETLRIPPNNMLIF